jgi:O-antigen ligase
MRELCLLAVAVIAPLVLTGLAAEITLGSFRPWAGDYRFSGSVHPNTQAMYLTTLALAALGLARSASRPRGWWLLCFAALFLLVLTKSRTGNAATLLAIGAVLTLQTPWQTKLSAALALATAAIATLWLVMVLGYDPLHDFRDALLLGRAEESDTLSGRKFIWPLVLEFVSQRAWLGYGYESFWNPQHIEQVSDELEWGVREAHNGYLEVLLSTGLVGLCLGIIATAAGIAAAAQATIRRRDPAYALPLGMLVFGLASSWMESGMVGIMCPPFLTACCLMRMAFADDHAAAAPPTEPAHARA